MLHAFESYCTRQASAAVLLASLEKEKELLRIFLRVSQMENTVLRRMNLNSFLMVIIEPGLSAVAFRGLAYCQYFLGPCSTRYQVPAAFG